MKAVWIVKSFVREHSHALAPPKHVHLLRSHRSINSKVKSIIDSMRAVSVITTKIIDLIVTRCGGYDNFGCIRQDIYNYIKSFRGVHKVDIHVKGLQAFFFFSKEESYPDFLFKKSVVDDKRLGSIFWANLISRFDYACFGDVIAFDFAFTKIYNRLIVNIICINHHHQTINFYCVVLTDSSTSNYVWMPNQFLSCMGGSKPQSVVINGEASMERAKKKFFLNCFIVYDHGI